MSKIAVFGGTFNPFHNGELNLGRAARDQFQLDKVIYMPNGTPPHKKIDVLDKELRYELVVAGIAGEKGFEASRIEVDRPGVTWTIDTLRELKKLHGDDTLLHFIMGEDNIKSFANYDLRDEFFKLCKLLIAPRITATRKDPSEWAALLPGADFAAIEIEASSLSSTFIRGKIRKGESIADLVPPGVLKILNEKGHYKDDPQESPKAA